MTNPFDKPPVPKTPGDKIENREKLKPRVLIADDYPGIREVSMALFTAYGYEVTLVEDGEELINEIKSGKYKYDLIITDNNMPKMSGLEALRILQDDPRFKDIPTIVVSGAVAGEEQQDREEARKVGATYISKPADNDTLVQTAQKLIEERKQRG